tara:strand:- start:8547 stop:8852 length:306 start_codon:yes stop_codon:yes gene_type:complete
MKRLIKKLLGIKELSQCALHNVMHCSCDYGFNTVLSIFNAMKIKLTSEQLENIRQEKQKEKLRLETIPKSGHGWDVIGCKDNIDTLTELLKNKEIVIYGNY